MICCQKCEYGIIFVPSNYEINGVVIYGVAVCPCCQGGFWECPTCTQEREQKNIDKLVLDK